MDISGLRFFVGLLAALFFAGCSFESSRQGKLELRDGPSLDIAEAIRDVLIGDFVGGPEPEIVVVSPSTIRVATPEGRIIRERHFPEAAFGRGLSADVDQDGKLDLVVGSLHGTSAKITLLNGLLSTLRVLPIIESIDATTVPVLFRKGILYAYSFSAANSSPKFFAALSLLDGRILFYFPMGPKPTSADLSVDGAILIGAMGVGKEGRRIPHPYNHEHDRNALFTLNPDGTLQSKLLQEGPMGWEHPAGDGTVYPKASFFIDSKGTERILRIVNTVSGLTDTQPEISILDRSGRVLNRRLGPAGSECTVAVNPGIGDWTFAAAWRSSGTIEFLDDALGLVATYAIDGKPSDTLILDAADCNGDGKTEVLASYDEAVLLIDGAQAGAVTCSVTGRVRGGRLVPNSRRPFVAIWSDKLHLYEISSGAVGADGVVGDGIAPASKGTHGRTFRAKPFIVSEERLRAKPVSLTSASLRTSIPRNGRSSFFLADATPDPGKELCAVSADTAHLEIFDSLGNLLRNIPLTEEEGSSAQSIGDYNGDGYDDLAVFGTEPLSVRFISASGTTLYSERFFYSNETYMTCSYWDDDYIVFSLYAGYRTSPRGALAVDRRNGTARLFNGVNSIPFNTVYVHEGLVYLPAFTPNNGARFIHRNGYVETDDRLCMKVFSLDTGVLHHAVTSPASSPSDRGYFTPFLIPDKDGLPVLYATEGKQNGYYDGAPAIYRVHTPQWTLEPVLWGPENSIGYAPMAGRVDGKKVYFAFWGSPFAVDILSEEFIPLRRLVSEEPVMPALVRVLDLDHDGTSELITLRDSKIVVLTADGKDILSFGGEDAQIGWYDIDGSRTSGGIHFYLLRKDRVDVYALE